MEHLYWSNWAQILQRKNLTGLTLTLLEGVGPVRYILSQLTLAVIPLFDESAHPSWKAFAEMMEDPHQSRSFSEFLREEKFD